jgi:hypothetical protein
VYLTDSPTRERESSEPEMRLTFAWTYVPLSAALLLTACAARPAAADPSPTSVALDPTHFVVVRADRVLVYEADPKHGYALRVVNSALLDENGQVIGQFRPEARPSVGPSALPAPVLPVPAPRSPSPTPSAPLDRPSEAAALRPALAPSSGLVGPRSQQPRHVAALSHRRSVGSRGARHNW